MSAQQRLEGPDLEALLAKVRADFGQRATILEANRVRRGGVGGFFSKESYEVVVDVDRGAGADDDSDGTDDEFVPLTLDELASRVDDPAPDFAAALAAAVEQNAAAMEPLAADEPDEPAWPAEAAIADVTPVVAAAPQIARLACGGLDAVEARPTPAPAPPSLSSADLDALARLGVPMDRLALPERTDEPPAVALVRLLERLPAPPPFPRTQGAIIALVGDRRATTDLAATFADELGIGPDEIVVAGRGRAAMVRTSDDADERRRAWRRRRRPTLVTVDAPFGIVEDDWAFDVLAALEPVLVMGHVDAWRKPEDVCAWATGLGGLDALAVDGLDRTTTPAAVLAVGVPVALLDGAPATPLRWAALLTDRLAA